METIPEQTTEDPKIAEDITRLEELLLEKSAQVGAVTEEIESKISSIEKANPDKAKKAKNRLRRLYGRFLTGLEITSVVFLVGTATYEKTRYAVREEIAQDKSVSYIHEDKETTEILNYLGGKSEINEESRLKIIRFLIAQMLERNSMNYSEGLKHANEKEILDIISKAIEFAKTKGDNRVGYLIYIKEALARDKDWSKMYAPKKLEFNSGIYEALWKVEKISGNPKVRWLDLDDAARLETSLFDKAAVYHPHSNTVFIRLPDNAITSSSDFPISVQSYYSVSDFVGESAHAKQFNEKPISSLATGLKDVVSTLIQALKTGDINEAYDSNYRTSGTLEHNAHSEIAGEFKQKFTKDMERRPPPYRGHRH